MIAEDSAAGLHLGALGVEFLGGQEVLVGMTRGEQPFRVGTVALGIAALEERPLVPGDTQPAEAIENHLGVRFGAALLVGVLDAQHEDPVVASREQPVEERRPGTTDVEVTGRGWGKSNARRGHWPPEGRKTTSRES